MKMGVLGSGMVAQGLSARLAELGHEVMIGTRQAEKLRGWQSSNMTHLLEVANGDHHVFVSSDDMDAKMQVMELLRSFGWIHIFDLGDLSTARYGSLYNAMGQALRVNEHWDDQHKNYEISRTCLKNT